MNQQPYSAQRSAAQRNSAREEKKTGSWYAIRRAYFPFLIRREKLKDYFAAGSIDFWFLSFVVILSVVGLVMMFSASYVNALYVNKDAYHYFKSQSVFLLIGLAAMYLVSRVRPDVFRDLSVIVSIGALFLLVYVLINPYSVPGKEEFKRWIEIFPGTDITMQPSEVAKLAIVMFCAWRMERDTKKIAKDWKQMFFYAAVIAVVCGLVYAENHLSGTILMFALGVAMTYLGGIKMAWYGVAASALAAAVLVLILVPPARTAAIDLLDDYAGDRITAWLDEDYSPDGARWQINQALYAIGSGGLFGTGLGNSRQKHMFVPEPQNDFVFAIVCEELGFVGAFLIIVLFVLLVGRGFVIALRAKNRFSALLVMGICFQVGLQTALNIAVVTGTVPNTGISMPFFSSGGTSLLMLLGEMGMVLAVSREAKLQKVQ